MSFENEDLFKIMFDMHTKFKIMRIYYTWRSQVGKWRQSLGKYGRGVACRILNGLDMSMHLVDLSMYPGNPGEFSK